MKNNKTLQIIFLLCGRKDYIDRYFKLIDIYKINFDILLIKENSTKFNKPLISNNNLITVNLVNRIYGMNDIFKAINNQNHILNKYKYINFLEDDNFVFPEALLKCEKYLEKNNDFIACNGLSFLFTKKKKYQFLNSYSNPNFKQKNLILRANEYKKNGGLLYYSVIRTAIFLKICQKISLIKDDNLSEVLFNYLILSYGKVKSLNVLYLAREYPRPKIYNIPSLDQWLNNKYLLDEINKIIKILTNEINQLHIINLEEFIKNTLYYYISIRLIGSKSIKKKFNSYYIIKKFFISNYLKYNLKVNSFLKFINY